MDLNRKENINAVTPLCFAIQARIKTVVHNTVFGDVDLGSKPSSKETSWPRAYQEKKAKTAFCCVCEVMSVRKPPQYAFYILSLNYIAYI